MRGVASLAGAVFPVVVVFVLTARPARLYAESAAALRCDDEYFDSCSGKTLGEGCSAIAEVERFCQGPIACREPDAAAPGIGGRLVCWPAPRCGEPGAVDACTGKGVGDTCTNGRAGRCTQLDCDLADGGRHPEIGCIVPPSAPTDAGGPTTMPTPGKRVGEDAGSADASDDSGCATAGGPGARDATTGLAALALAVVGFRRRLRRR